MLPQTRDPILRRALLGLWVEPWRAADLAWCGTGVWPAWLDWVVQQSPELLPGLWADWCDAVGTAPGAGLEQWLGLGAPLEGAWRDVARLSSLSSDRLLRALAICGAVSVFSRSDGGVLWVESQANRDPQQDEACFRCVLAGWRLSRLYRLTPAELPVERHLSMTTYVHQGVRVLLSGAHSEWHDVWALVWPHWRWRLHPAWAEAVGVDVRQAGQVPVLSWDAGAFSRVWALALAREESQ
jgi:hypothetical protein